MFDLSVEESESGKVSPPPSEQIIVFGLHDEFFGFGIPLINEISEVVHLNAVPKAPDFIAGAINYHGRIVAIVSLARFFNLPSRERGALSRIIVMVPDDYSIGFIVDSIKEITYIPEEPEESNPMEGETFKNRYIEKVLCIGEALVNILDVKKLLSEFEDYFKEVKVEY